MCDKETRFEELAHRWSSSLIRNFQETKELKGQIYSNDSLAQKKRESHNGAFYVFFSIWDLFT